MTQDEARKMIDAWRNSPTGAAVSGAYKIFDEAYSVVMKESHGTEPLLARVAGVEALEKWKAQNAKP